MSGPSLLTLPVKDWPELDRVHWMNALACSTPFGAKSPAAAWSAARVHIVEDVYGQWLAYLVTQGILEPIEPSERVTLERVAAYIGVLTARVAPVSVAMMIGALGRMMVALYPTKDWTWLRNIYQYLKVTALPVRNKRQLVVPARDLYHVGLRLMDEADREGRHPFFNAAEYRDGLLIAILAALPVRMANLSSITIGTHLMRNDAEYWLRFSEEETKNDHKIEAPLPIQLTIYLERYFKTHRRVLLDRRLIKTIPPTRHLWVNRAGLAMAASAIRAQIKLRTKHEFGHAIWPHLFRDCVATSIAIEDPQNVHIASEMLTHQCDATTDKYYDQSQSIDASRIYQEAIRTLRARLSKVDSNTDLDDDD
jgi:integrase/recombinase XerD